MFFNAIFVYTLPTITIVFFNLQLIRVLHRLKSRTKRLRQKNKIIQINNQHTRRSQQSKYSVTIMVIVMVLTLLICRSPTIVLWVLWSFELTIKIFFDSASSSGVRRFHNIANLIAIINAATNFLPFCVFGQLFRSECLNVYCCRKQTSKQLAKQAKRKHEVINQEPKSVVSFQPALTTRNDHLQTILPLNSETTSGVTSSVHQSSSFCSPTNIVRLSDIPFNPATSHGQRHSKNSLVTTSLLKETAGL
jgi:predicted membrane protein